MDTDARRQITTVRVVRFTSEHFSDVLEDASRLEKVRRLRATRLLKSALSYFTNSLSLFWLSELSLLVLARRLCSTRPPGGPLTKFARMFPPPRYPYDRFRNSCTYLIPSAGCVVARSGVKNCRRPFVTAYILPAPAIVVPLSLESVFYSVSRNYRFSNGNDGKSFFLSNRPGRMTNI